jgi:hypothetical protein
VQAAIDRMLTDCRAPGSSPRRSTAAAR